MSDRYSAFMAAGKSALESKDGAAARQAFEAAARIRIGDPVSRHMLVEAALLDGDKVAARDAMNEFLILRPADIGVLSKLGNLELEQGNIERGAELSRAAAAALKRRMSRRVSAILSTPGHFITAVAGRLSGKWPDIRVASLCNKATVALADRRLLEAAGFLQRAEQRAPSHPNVLHLLAQYLVASGAPQSELACLRKAGETQPKDWKIETATIVALARADLGREALQRLEALPENVRQSRDGKVAEAYALFANGKIEGARDIFAGLLEAGTESGELAFELALRESSLGHFEAARDAFKTAASLAPRFGQIYWSATTAKCIEKDDELFKSAQLLSQDSEASQLDRAFAEMAVGRALIQTGDDKSGFAHLKRGNAMVEREYDPQEQEARIDSLIKAFPQSLYSERERSERGEKRIFIIGLPRSGSALIEQILSSHPMVFGAGERYTIPQIVGRLDERGSYPEAVAAIDQTELDLMAEEYLAAVTSEPSGEPVVTDKNLYNLHHLGLIVLIFPTAKIIHCRRDIIDNGFSIYSHWFNTAYPYANDLRNIGHYYGQYRRLMNHWAEALPTPIYDIDYERLIDDQETEIRKLLDAAGLPFDEACLRFHESKRAVTTSSVAQIRQRIHRGSIGVSRRFEAELEPLREIVA